MFTYAISCSDGSREVFGSVKELVDDVIRTASVEYKAELAHWLAGGCEGVALIANGRNGYDVISEYRF